MSFVTWQPPGPAGPLPSYRRGERRAVTLLELIAVVAILAIVTTVAISRIGPGPLANFGARANAQRVAVDLLQTRRRSIFTGENHFLRFSSAGGQITGYTLYRRDPGLGSVAVDSPHVFPADIVVSTSHNEAEFTFEGAALGAYQVTLVGAEQTWRVDVVPVTGTAVISQTAP